MMGKKVEVLSVHRRKRKPRSLDEIAKAAARRFLDGTPKEEEPQGLASGDMNEFLRDQDEWEKKNEED